MNPFNETNTELIHRSNLVDVYEYKIVDTVSLDGNKTGALCDIVRFIPEEMQSSLNEKFYASQNDPDGISGGLCQNYFMLNYSDAIRGWHYHQYREDHFYGLFGVAKLAVTDGEGNFECYYLSNRIIKVYPKVWHAIKGNNIPGNQNEVAITSIVGNACFPAYTEDKPDQKSKEFEFDWEVTKF